MLEIILASASPRRSELLNQAGLPFTVIPGDVDEENAVLTGTPGQKAEQLARMKASDVVKKVDKGLVLGADTIVVYENEIFGKPADEEDARRMLKRLSGHEHQVITGIAVIDATNGRTETGHEITKVRFSKLTAMEIEAYIKTGEPFDKAGAYAVQGKGALLVDSMNGCYSNVVGLPLRRLSEMLKEFGVHIMEKIW